MRRIAFAVSAIWLSRIVAIVLGLVLMPVLFSNLPKAELGVWLLLNQSGLLLLLLDFGLTSTLTRRFAFRRAEAAGGLDKPLTADDAASFAQLMATARWLYQAISLGVGLLAWLGGLLFIDRLGLDPRLLGDARIAWTIICFSQMIALSSGLWTSIIAGLGHVAPVSLLTIGFTSLTIAGQAIAVMLGGGLITLATAGALGGVAFRIAAIVYLRRSEPALASCRGRWDRAEAATILAPSLKYFLTEIGAILLTRTDQFFIAAYLNPESIPNYFASYTLAFNAAVIAIAIGDAANIYVSQLWRLETIERVRLLVLKSMRIGMGLMALASALLLVSGDAFVTLWLGPDHYVGLPVMATFCAMFIVYTQQSLLFGFSRATENEIYAPSYLAAGALNLGLSVLLAPRLGLTGIALATLLAQLLTTGWYVPSTALRRLGVAPGLYAVHVLAPVGAMFVVAVGAMELATWPLPAESSFDRALTSALIGIALGGAGFWAFVLDDELRAAIRRRLRSKRPGRLAPDA